MKSFAFVHVLCRLTPSLHQSDTWWLDTGWTGLAEASYCRSFSSKISATVGLNRSLFGLFRSISSFYVSPEKILTGGGWSTFPSTSLGHLGHTRSLAFLVGWFGHTRSVSRLFSLPLVSPSLGQKSVTEKVSVPMEWPHNISSSCPNASICHKE